MFAMLFGALATHPVEGWRAVAAEVRAPLQEP